jgi:Na+/H+ antiporter NhaD/arsenite permease-like protein
VAYLVAIVAAANAGGAGSVVGDTTTTMMWLAGVPAAEVLPATLAAAVALAVCGIPASIQQQAFSPIRRDAPAGLQVDGVRLMIVLAMLGAAVATNVVVSLHFSAWADRFPFLGCSVWVALLLGSPWRRPAWSLLPAAGLGAAFLLSLVLCASMMPVERLPAASWASTLGLGFLSAVFDNIPLTALALKQGGYDWAFLAYAVGFGGSMMWFGSSAGVALAGMYPQARSVREWLRKGWYVVPAYLIGFAVMLGLLGYRPGTLLAGHG